MTLLSVSQFKMFCLENGISKFIFSTADQEDDMKTCGRAVSMSFHSVHIMLQPNCVVFQNENGSMRFGGVKHIRCDSVCDSCYSFTIICSNLYGGSEMCHKIIGTVQ